MKILVLFYSTYGHVYNMAKAIVEGAQEIEGVQVILKQVPETLNTDILSMIGADKTRAEFAHIPIADPMELAEYDGIILGAPTRYGMMASQMKAFLDGTGSLWAKGALVGKVGGAFSSSATQHGGQESTILGFHTVMLHHGMVIAGLPYTFAGQSILSEVTGGSPYGASVVAGNGKNHQPTENELNGARFQGKYVAGLVKKLSSD